MLLSYYSIVLSNLFLVEEKELFILFQSDGTMHSTHSLVNTQTDNLGQLS